MKCFTAKKLLGRQIQPANPIPTCQQIGLYCLTILDVTIL